ncbi:MAG: PASTA domain-containing protein [Candidatus Sumerlaeota bacterium]
MTPTLKPPEGQKKGGFWRDLLERVLYFWWQVVVLLVVAIASFAAAGWGGYMLVSRHVKAREVPVPNLMGYQVEQAAQLLHDKDTELAIQIDGRRYSDEIAAGEILSQHPGGNTFAKAGSIVRVVVSMGTSRVECPDVRGVEYLEAGINLRQKDLVEGRKSFMHDGKVERDLVIAQNPAAGTPLLRGTEVHLLVSLGKEPERFLMPNVPDTPVTEARILLSNMGFSDVTVDAGAFPGKSNNLVFRCDPAPGSVIGPDTEIKLTVVKN